MEVDISAYEEIIFDRSPMTELTSTKPMVMTPGKNKCSTGKTGNEEFMSFFADKNGCGGFKDFFTDKLNVSEKNDGEV
jgi:hypothetical protein